MMAVISLGVGCCGTCPIVMAPVRTAAAVNPQRPRAERFVLDVVGMVEADTYITPVGCGSVDGDRLRSF